MNTSSPRNLLTIINILLSSVVADPVVPIEKSSWPMKILFESFFPNYHFDLIVIGNWTTSTSQFIHAEVPTKSLRSISQIDVGVRNISAPFIAKTTGGDDLFNIFKYSSGYVHVYFTSPEVDFLKASTTLVAKIMPTFRNWTNWSTWPNHFMFVNHKPSSLTKLAFYANELPKTFVRGVILDVDLNSRQISLVCVQCPHENVLALIDPFNFDTPKLITSYRRRSSQLYGGYVKSYLPAETVDLMLKSCNLTARRIPDVVLKSSFFVCFHLILGETLNYTYATCFPPDNSKALVPKFSTREALIYHEENIEEFKIGREGEHIPYALTYNKFNFLPFQRPSGNVLTKPYDWVTWLSLSLGAVSLGILTLMFQQGNKLPGNSGATVAMSILATMLEQDVARTFTRRVVFGSEVLPCVWLLWFLMMIIIVNGYTGLLFSLMTNGEVLHWPGSLAELIQNSDYCVISGHVAKVLNISGHVKETFSRVRFLFINPAVKNRLGGDSFLAQLEGLNKSLQFHEKKGNLSLGAEVTIVESKFDSTGNFKLGKEDCSKFALVEEDPREDGMFISSLLESVVQGSLVSIPGYSTITSLILERNFFHESFLTGMAYLDASGFNAAVEKHVKKWFICSRIYAYLRNHQGNAMKFKESKNWKRNLVNCVHQADKLLASDNTGTRDSDDAKPISMHHLRTSFTICFIGLAVAFVAFFHEILKIKFQSILNFSRGQKRK